MLIILILLIKTSEKQLKISLKEIFDKISDKEDFYFSPSSSFVKGAGQGLQSKLYKQMAYDLSKAMVIFELGYVW